MFAGIGAWVAKQVFFRKAGAVLGSIPWQVWVTVIALIALFFGHRMHQHEVHKTWQSGYDQAVADIKAAEASKVAPIVTAKQVGDASITAGDQGVKKEYATQNNHVSSNVADLLRMYEQPTNSRPDAQPVGNLSGAPAVAGPSDPAARPDDGLAQAGKAGQPTITVDARELIERAGRCDSDYLALKAWEASYANYKQAYDAWKAKVSKP